MTVVCMVTPNCRKKKKGCDNCLSSQLLKISYICRVHYTALGLLLWVPAATKRLVSSVTPIISRSDVSKYYTGSAPWGVLDVELGFGTVIQVPESTVDTVTQFIVDSWWAVFFLLTDSTISKDLCNILSLNTYEAFIYMDNYSMRIWQSAENHLATYKGMKSTVLCQHVEGDTSTPQSACENDHFCTWPPSDTLTTSKHTNTHTMLPLLTANILSVGRKSLKWQSVLLNYQAVQKETPGPRCRRDNS